MMTEADYIAARRENQDALRRQRWWWRHFLAGNLKSQLERERLRQATLAENEMACYLQGEFGYQVHLTTKQCPFDLWVADGQGRGARVEVKLSTCRLASRGRGHRFQANIRRHKDAADVLIFIARNGRDWPFVIPMGQVGSRRNIAIWSACPGNYTGQWAPYLEAWDYLHQTISHSRPCQWQLGLPA